MKQTNNDSSEKKSCRGWIVPLLIVAANAAAIVVRWSSLQELMPAHFNLQGNAGGTMPRTMLVLYPLISAAICLIAWLITKRKQRLQTGLIILVSGIALVILFSTLVTLTAGTMPVFMLAEPVILVAAVIACIVCIVKSKS